MPCKGGKVQLAGAAHRRSSAAHILSAHPASSSSPRLRWPARVQLPPIVKARRGRSVMG